MNNPDTDFHRLTSQKKMATTQPINFSVINQGGSCYDFNQSAAEILLEFTNTSEV